MQTTCLIILSIVISALLTISFALHLRNRALLGELQKAKAATAEANRKLALARVIFLVPFKFNIEPGMTVVDFDLLKKSKQQIEALIPAGTGEESPK